MNFGDVLKKERENKELTQSELGKLLSVSDATINRYEKELRFPDKETLTKIAEIFDCSVDYLLGRTNLKNPFIPQEYEEKHGSVTNKELKEYEDFMGEANIFFMNDEVSEDDKEALFRDISELFWKSKEINKEKYGRKKGKKE